jgi:vitamin B12 transporter
MKALLILVWLWIAGLTVLLSVDVQAQVSTFPVQEVVVTPTRTEIPVGQSISSVSVITGEDLRRMGVISVSEALRHVPGLDVVQAGGPGQLTSVFLRGANSQHTLVLVDGIQINSPTVGGFDFGGLTVDNIDRIEILRGPQSSLYGSDALGGVIQIISKKADISSASVSVEGGSFGSARESVAMGLKKEGFDLSMSGSRWDSEGISAASSGAERDGYQNTTLSVRLGTTPSPGSRMDLTARLVESDAEIDGFSAGTAADDLTAQLGRRLAVVGGTWTGYGNALWEQRISASAHEERLLYSGSPTDMGTRTVEWQGTFKGADSSRLILGYEWQRQDGKDSYSLNRELTNHGVYIQDNRGIGTPLQTLFGLRWDDSTLSQREFTYRAGISYTTATRVLWRAQAATGFRLPTLYDLDPTFGNPALNPEKSKGWEVGATQNTGPVSLGLTYFNNRFKNLIVLDSNYIPQNVGKARSSGIECELTWRPAQGVRLRGTYTYDDTENETTHTSLIRRPLNKYETEMNIELSSRTEIGLRWNHVGRRFDQGQDALPAYSRWDLNGFYKVRQTFEVFYRFENLLDQQYEEVKGYGTPGFSAYGGVRISL